MSAHHSSGERAVNLSRRMATRQPWVKLFGIGFASGLLGQLASHILFVRPAEITSIWIPGGLMLGFLACRPLRQWPALLAGFILGGVAVFVMRSGILFYPFVGYLWLTVCVAVGAAMIKLTPGQRTMFPTVGHLGQFFMFIVVGASMSMACGFVGIVSLMRNDVSLPRLWFLSTTAFAVAFMLITPLVVELHRTRIPPWQQIRKQFVGFLLFSVGLWLVSLFVWNAVPSNLSSIPLVLFAPVPLLMLAAFQFGKFGPSVGLIVAFLPAIVFAIRLDRYDTFEIGFVNSYIMQLWTLAAGVLVHALSIQARQRDEILQRLYLKSAENKSLAARVMQSQEEQSMRLSRELHDGVNQKLTFFSIVLSSIKQRSPPEMQEPIQEVSNGIRDLIDEVRDISHSLHPAVLEHAGIAGAIDDLVRLIEGRWGGEILLRIDIESDQDKLRGERALCIYRLAQEAIRNAIEHSGASAIKVVLAAQSDRWKLRVSDNGRGFVPGESAMRTGLGLLSMRERVQAVGGTLHIRSRPGKGTSISMELGV